MIIEALNALGINSEFCLDANVTTEQHYLRTYRDLTDQNRFFEWSVVSAKIEELQAEYDANKYQRDRQPEYPSIQDQLDMQFWDKVNGTNNWQEAIQAVKTKHPKPE